MSANPDLGMLGEKHSFFKKNLSIIFSLEICNSPNWTIEIIFSPHSFWPIWSTFFPLKITNLDDLNPSVSCNAKIAVPKEEEVMSLEIKGSGILMKIFGT